MIDPYEALGLPRDATSEDIRKAYRQRAKKAHPDAGGSTEEFEAISRAMTLLTDPVRRERFDDYGDTSETPDNVEVMAMELVVQFISNSLEAVAQNNLPMHDLNFIEGGKIWCDQRIGEFKKFNRTFQQQIKLREKVKKRLRTKRASDPVSRMLDHQIGEFKTRIAGNEKQIEITARARQLFGDYEFLPDPDEPAATHQVPPGFFGRGRGPFTSGGFT